MLMYRNVAKSRIFFGFWAADRYSAACGGELWAIKNTLKTTARNIS